jgi:hypothetical protein
MGLLKAAADTMNCHFPELGVHRLENLGIVDPLH